MKKSLLFVFFACCQQLFCQNPDPDLIGTWYMKSMQLTDMATLYNVLSIQPPISPYLVIESETEFNGFGACNSFDGTYETPMPQLMETTLFTATSNNCNVQVHNNFENDYFLLMDEGPGDYVISQDGSGNILTFWNALGGATVFQNYPLSLDNFEKIKFSIYPNPSSGRINIEASEIIESITLYDISGRIISEFLNLKTTTHSSDISRYDSGIYFIVGRTEDGRNFNSQVIKQ